jgi:hypothetical protein
MEYHLWPCRVPSARSLDPVWSKISNALKRLGFGSHNILAQQLSETCGWRIVVLPIFPYDFPSCYDSAMSNLVILFIHFLATLARLLGPGGVRSIVAESLILKHQLLIVARSRQRSPNLCTSDRILVGLMALLVRPTPLLRSAIVLKPSTLLALHKSMNNGKYRMLFFPGSPPAARPARSERRLRPESC